MKPKDAETLPRAMLHQRRVLPLLKQIRGAILASKPPECGEYPRKSQPVVKYPAPMQNSVKPQRMNFWRGYLRQVFPAFWHALALTDTLVIGVFILSGISFAFFGRNAEHPSWWIALAIFMLSLLTLLVRIPYRLYAEQRVTINELDDKIAEISEDRPLSFTGLSIESVSQHRLPFGPYTIERIELGFENRGERRLSWEITEFFYEIGEVRSEIPLPVGAGKYSLLARECVGYGFDVEGLQIQSGATPFRVGFSIEYDNIPPLNARRMKRVLDCAVRSLRPMRYDVNIIEQAEC